MRRVVGIVLSGLGVFFIALALLFRFYVPSQALKFPLNEYDKSTLIATGASYFSPKNVTEVSGATLQVTSTIVGNVPDAVQLGSGNTAVWQSFAPVEDITNHVAVEIPAAPNVLAFNRKTGVLVPWSGDTVDGKHVSVSGQGSLWPLGAQKHSYQVFDTTLRKPVTFRYTGSATTDGVPTYVYAAVIPSQQIGTQSLPGSLVGMTAALVTLPEFYSANETFYVDPETGVPLSVRENIQQVLKDSSGTTRLVLISADLKSAPASVASGAQTDKNARSEISLLTVILPLAAGVLGLVLLVIGVIMSGSVAREYDEEDSEPVGASV